MTEPGIQNPKLYTDFLHAEKCILKNVYLENGRGINFKLMSLDLYTLIP